MIAIAIGCLLLGGGLKGAVDDLIKQPRRPVGDQTPVRSS